MIAPWGESAIAVQKVGIHVKSISYMAAEGFAAATNSFIAQNYGAHLFDRSRKGYSMDSLIFCRYFLKLPENG